MKSKLKILFSVILALAVAIPLTIPHQSAAADPAVLQVCSSGCTYSTVQQAVDAANPGDEIRIAEGTYTGVTSPNGSAQMVYITKSLTLRGGYNGDFTARDPETYLTILDAQEQGRVFYIDGSAGPALIDVTLDGLQITRGRWTASEYVGYNDLVNLDNSWWQAALGGGMRVRKTNLVMDHCLLKDNHTNNGVGSGLFQHYGTFTMQNSVVDSNGGFGTYGPFLGEVGGGLFFLQVTVNIHDSTLQNNSAGYGNSNLGDEADGGAVFLNHSTATIDHTAFLNNTASRNEYGRGGAIYSTFGTLTLTNSTVTNNKGCESHRYCIGGAIYSNTTTILTGNIIEGSLDGGLYVTNSMTITGNTIRNNTGGVSSAVTFAGGGYLVGSGTFDNNIVTANTGPGGGGGFFGGTLSLTGNTFDGNTSTGNGGGMIVNDTVALTRNLIQNNTAAGCGGGLMTNGLSLEDGDRIFNNTALNGGGLCIKANKSSASYQNLALLNNQGTANGSGIYVDRGSTSGTVYLRHLTLSSNTGGDGAGVTVNSGTVNFVNTILFNQAVGVHTIGGNPTFDHTLRYQVTTPVVGVASDLFATTGDPAFDADGYHLTLGSAAIDAGIATPVNDDVDGGARPLGDAPDIGAVESPFTSDIPDGVQASLTAGAPQWIMQWNTNSSGTSYVLQQDYLVKFSYGDAAGAPYMATYSVKNTLPPALQLSEQHSSPIMLFSQTGNQLTWNSAAALKPGSAGWVSILGESTGVVPGAALNDTGHFDFTLDTSDVYSIPLQAAGTVPEKPLKPPFLVSPMNGEMCLDESGKLAANGLTDAGLIVKLYENEAEVGVTTADDNGKFAFNWTSALTNENPVNLYAVVCDPALPSSCSAPSRSVHIDFPQAFWCPQRSYWEGTVGSVHYLFHFVNDLGHYATNDFMIPGVHGFAGTQLHLYSCCDRDTNPFTVKADGITYPPTGHDGRIWNFTIGSAHNITVQSQCQVGGDDPSHGTVLIDPDGFVFDSTQGGEYDAITGMFTPAVALAGATVTAYEYIPEWETWVVWPASLYNDQVNPQVTGADGYFAFFTPPGQYYLEATGLDGYQTWRSPVIEVVAEIVHANIPLTPVNSDSVTQIILTPDGPNLPWVRIRPGKTVEWVSTAGSSPTLAEIVNLTKNPIQRILSSLDPLTNVLGFDSGRLTPGQVFRRKFDKPGLYTYSDGAGHTGHVIVSEGAFLPLIRR